MHANSVLVVKTQLSCYTLTQPNTLKDEYSTHALYSRDAVIILQGV